MLRWRIRESRARVRLALTITRLTGESLMKSHYPVVAILLCLAIDARGADSVTILESATVGPSGQGTGPTIASFQYVGARFHISKPTLVDHVGGYLGDVISGPFTIFGAITSITSPTGFPSVRPSDFQPLAVTTFDVGSPNQDELVPLNVLLQPGNYALIFGSGRFGATGKGQMPRGNHDTSQASYFIGEFPNINNSGWRNESGFRNMRFLVTGTVLPEPTTYGMLAFGAFAVLAARQTFCGQRRTGTKRGGRG